MWNNIKKFHNNWPVMEIETRVVVFSIGTVYHAN